MKKLFILLFLSASLYSEAQFPTTITSGNTSTLQKANGAYGAAIGYVFAGSYGDTAAANLSFIKNIPGIVIRIGDDLWIRNNAANRWIKIGTGAGSTNAFTYPLVSTNDTVNLKSKIPFQDFATSSPSPYAPQLNWDTVTGTTTPHWYDGTALAYTQTGDTLVRPYGWYSNGSTYSSDSIYLSVPPYSTWTLSTTRFPIRTHWVAYSYNSARGYWFFCGGDADNTTTQQKTVITTTDFRTFTTRTTNYGGQPRVLGSAWADDNGTIYWGFGQSDVLDTANHLDDIWMSKDDGVTWTQIATNLSVGGVTLGGNDGNQVHYRNGFVYGLGLGGKYGTTKTYSKKTFKANINDLTKWWAIDTIPISSGVQYPATRLFNGWLWYINGNDGSSNTASVYYLDVQDKWHTFNAGGYGNISLGISHAQGSVVYKNNLYIATGNDNNETYVLRRDKKEFLEPYKQMFGNVYVGRPVDGYSFRLNTDVGSEAPNTFVELNAPVSNRNLTTLMTSDAFIAFKLNPQTVSNNATGIGFADRWAIGSGHGTGTYAGALIAYNYADNNIPLVIKNNNHFIINASNNTIPTNTSYLQVKGLTSGSPTDSLMTIDANGNVFYRDASSLSGATPTLQQVLTSGNSATTLIDGMDYRVWPINAGVRYTSSWMSAIASSGNGVNAEGGLNLRAWSTGGGNVATIYPRADMTQDLEFRLPNTGNVLDTLATLADVRGGGSSSTLQNVTNAGNKTTDNIIVTDYALDSTIIKQGSIEVYNPYNGSTAMQPGYVVAQNGLGARWIAGNEVGMSNAGSGFNTSLKNINPSASNEFYLREGNTVSHIDTLATLVDIRPIRFTPSTSTDTGQPVNTITVDDTYLWYRKPSGTWVKIPWQAF